MIRIERFRFEDKILRRQAFAIRTRVFVEEQHVDPKLEYDEFEKTSHHYLAFADGQPIGTARWRETPKGIKLERFAVLPEFRDHKTGAALLKMVLDDTVPLNKLIYLHSQIRAVPFYERHGFKIRGGSFFEAGMEHYLMVYSDAVVIKA